MRLAFKGGDSMELRTILYGYGKYKFDYYIIPEEANIVRWIFFEYLTGKSLKSIADELTVKEIMYYKDRYNWSKNAVKRILENEHYMGDCEYPAIIDSNTFYIANEARLEKGGVHEKPTKEIAFFKSICYCEVCNKHFGRIKYQNNRSRWLCRNGCKTTKIFLDDETVFEKINGIILWVVNNPELLRLKHITKKAEIPRELLIEERELKFKLLDYGKYSFEIMQKELYELASRKFQYMNINYSKSVTDSLRAYVVSYNFTDRKLDIAFLKVAVSKVTIKSS